MRHHVFTPRVPRAKSMDAASSEASGLASFSISGVSWASVAIYRRVKLCFLWVLLLIILLSSKLPNSVTENTLVLLVFN